MDEQVQSSDGAAAEPGSASSAPSISLPKGGGAIRGIGEKFAANPVTGTASISVPIYTSPGRSGFSPQLSLSYDSGAGNGMFGFGWSLSLPAISRKTDKGLPQYFDLAESDVFILSGAEDLVPVLVEDAAGKWERENLPERTVGGVAYRVQRYRPRIEGLFALIERWTSSADPADTFWRSISKDNVTTWYGRTSESRIADPLDGKRTFTWLICLTHDDKGNAIVFDYRPDDSAGIFDGRAPPAHERNRTDLTRSAQRYPKRIRYGNRTPYLPVLETDQPWPEPPNGKGGDSDEDWHFEAVFDFGEHDPDAPSSADEAEWPVRPDPFSSYRAGFEVRTYRLCQRVLMFHHFPQETGVGEDCLVRSTDFNYAAEQDPTDVRNPVYSFLRSVAQQGYRRNGGGYERRSLPPVEFEYTRPVVHDVVEDVAAESLENLPVGVDGNAYRWTDLHGEGVPGILSEQAGAWFYKRNLSSIPTLLPDGREVLSARFAPTEIVRSRPNVALAGGAEIMDLAGDGQPDVVVMEGPSPGLFEHDEAEGWQPFRPFISRPTRDLRDPNVRLVDLDGDGHADVLITEDRALLWSPSLGEEGFGAERRVAQQLDEEKGPRVVFADGTESIYLADLSGDGLTDIVRIRNGEVCYWPNLGYGRFGAKVTMDNAPWFDFPDQFDHQRIRLADIDGSGTTDIIYLRGDGARLYFNQSGNGWSEPHALKAFPRIDNLARIVAADLLGNGTACLVWSSPSPADGGRPMRYVRLMGGSKPHLLVRICNNLGAETRISYAPSTRFYLQDKSEGRPWITRLPFPVHVVERVETYDFIGRNRFVSRYAYHHGYFDGEEREFRGFAMVEQWDTEALASLADGSFAADNIALPSNVPPVHTRSWFHTGCFLGHRDMSELFAGRGRPLSTREYFQEPGLSEAEDRALRLAPSALPEGLTVAEEREARRALKGALLRQEIYADDACPGSSAEAIKRATLPYIVTEQNFRVRKLQPRGRDRHAVFLTHPSETLTYHYERNPADPRIQHKLNLEVDDHGNVLKQAAFGYGRRAEVRVADEQGHVRLEPNPGLRLLGPADQARQTCSLLTYTENRPSNAVLSEDVHRLPLQSETITFELTGYAATGPAGRYQASDLVEPDPAHPGRVRHKFSQEIPYEQAAAGEQCRRPIDWQRNLYRRDDLAGLLPLGELQSLGLRGEVYKLAFTPGLLEQVFQRKREGGPAEPLLPDPAEVLAGQAGNQGGYVESRTLRSDGRFPTGDPDGHWWIPSGRSFFSPSAKDNAGTELQEARQHFYLPRRYQDPFGQDSFVDFDPYDLLVAETRDALGNRVTVDAADYRVLQPSLISDPNRNRTEVAFDVLGMVAGTAVMGKPPPASAEGDSLAGFVTELERTRIDRFFDANDPHACAAELLKDATTRVVYDIDRYRRSRQENPDNPDKWQPAGVATLVRETHVNAPLPPHGLKAQLGFSYSDGFGREIQNKMQAEPGPVPRRDNAGRMLVDEDGLPELTEADMEPRWVGSGWTVLNNKGKPVRQYEPYFTDTARFEFDVRIGVSPVLFYDPAERVVATLHPNHTYDKVVYDPWQQITYDANDTCAARNGQTGEPWTDPDIGGYVAGYFESGVAARKTWFAERIDGALGPHERTAARRAAAHSDTPLTAHFDALGRPFLTIAANRVSCAGHDLDGSELSLATRVELDIEGNQRVVRDADDQADDLLGRIVGRSAYDMLGNRIYQDSMEAGARWTLNDSVSKAIRAWDSRGHIFSSTYDALRRPVEQVVRGTNKESDPRTLDDDILVDRIEYGEVLADAQALNLRTRTYRHFDSAGIATNARLDAGRNPNAAYDFKGNLLHTTRQLVSDYKAIPNWRLNPDLEQESFTAATRFDALNRPIQTVAPHSSRGRGKINVIQPAFNEANLLERVDVWLEQATEPAALLDPKRAAPSPVGISDIDYDAKGQRLAIAYKNGACTSYAYDPLTFRLTQLRTMREGGESAGEKRQTPGSGALALQVQDLHYTYDPIGNITHIEDGVLQTIWFRNKCVGAHNDYVYDALYRLIEATGREHLGQCGSSIPYSDDDSERIGLLNPADGRAMARYTEHYVHDVAGNLLQMQHRGADAAHPGWTRRYNYDEPSLIEANKKSNRLSGTQTGDGPDASRARYLHDAHGNMLHMPHLGGSTASPNLHWNYKDQLREIGKGGGGRAFYVYDASGQRVRKVWEKTPGCIEERIYIGGFEVFRRHGGSIGAACPTLERETLHVMDDARRMALVETRTLDSTGDDPAPRQAVRYQLSNHLGSSCVELDEAAQLVSYEEYAPFGTSTYQAVRNQTETPKRYRFTGKERDEESHFYYHGARYYVPWLGRWLSTDPAGFADGLNSYAYVRNNPVQFTDSTGAQCDPTTASCIDATQPEDSSDLVCRAEDSSNPLPFVSGAFSSAGNLLGSLAPTAPVATAAPTIPGAAAGTDFAAEAAAARQAYRAANVMPPGTQVQHWTKELSAAATGMDPAVMNLNLSPLQSRNALPATTLLVDPAGAGTTYSVDGGSVFGNEHKFADRFLIPQIEDQIRAANPGATPREISEAAGRQARWMMTGEPGPSALPPFPEAAGMSSSARWLTAGGGALNFAGGAFMLASVDPEHDPGLLTAGKLTSGSASLVGGGMEITGAWLGEAGLVELGGAASGVGLIVAVPVIAYQVYHPQGIMAYDPSLVDRALAEGRNPFCAQCHGPGGALDPNNDWNSRDPARRAAFMRRLQWVDLGR